MAILSTVLFSASVLAHELSHALVARRRGLEVEGITLFLFGGATETVTEAASSSDEFAVTAAGPLTNLILAVLFWLVAYGSRHLGWAAPAYVAGEIAWLNVLLGGFNLLPGSPLDGGGLVEAVVWRVTGDRLRAARIAASAGELLGVLLLTAGLFELFGVSDQTSNGVWLSLTGWFIIQGAKAVRARAEMRRLVGSVPAKHVAFTPPVVPATTTLAPTAAIFQRNQTDSVFVSDVDKIVGVLTLDVVRQVPAFLRATTEAGEVAIPIDSLPSIAGDQPVAIVLDRLERGPVVVTEDGQPVSLLTMDRVAAAAERIRLLRRVTAGPRVGA